MRTEIWRFSVPLENNGKGTTVFEVAVPHGSVLLSAAQRGNCWQPLDVWASVLVDEREDAPTERRRIIVVGTGFEVPRPIKRFISTVVSPDEKYVWHVFDGGVI